MTEDRKHFSASFPPSVSLSSIDFFFLILVPSAHSLGWAQDLSVCVTELPGRVFERKMARLMPGLVCFWSTMGSKFSSRAVMMLPYQRPRMDHQGLEN